MAKEECCKKGCGKCCGGGVNTGGSAVYGLGFLGAVIYFLQQATSLQTGLIGIVKAVFWPALLVYKALGLLNF